MNCKEREHDIVLFLYDELDEPERLQVHGHLARCPGCQDFVEKEKRLHSELTNDSSEWKTPPDLLVECRRALSDELDRLETRRAWWRHPLRGSGMRWLESAALVSIGLALGAYVSTQRAAPPTPSSNPTRSSILVSDESAVSNLRVVQADPVSGEIELAGEVVRPMRLQGTLEDEDVQQFLFNALSAPTNPGERLRVVELLAPNARDAIVQKALIGSLLHDDNPGVRLYALQGLKPYAADEAVRTALLDVLEHDDNPGIRVEAIDALTPLSQDEAMEEVVQEAVRADPNAYVRMRALQFVGR